MAAAGPGNGQALTPAGLGFRQQANGPARGSEGGWGIRIASDGAASGPAD